MMKNSFLPFLLVVLTFALASSNWGMPPENTPIVTTELLHLNCPTVSDLSVQQPNPNSAMISWTSSGSETSWEIKYLPGNNFDPNTNGISVTTDNSPFTLTNLSSNTQHYLYVRADCGEGNTSDWTGPLYFITACTLVTSFPWIETFDDASANNAIQCFINQGEEPWKLAQTGFTGSINGGVTDPMDHTTGSGKFVWQDGSSGGFDSNELITPFFDLTGLEVPTFEYYILSNNTVDNTLNEVETYAWNGTDWQLIHTYAAHNPVWVRVTIGLPVGIPDTTRFRLVAVEDSRVGANYFNNDLLVDDLSVLEGVGADLTIQNMIVPDGTCGLTNNESVDVIIRNLNGAVLRPGRAIVTLDGANSFVDEVYNATFVPVGGIETVTLTGVDLGGGGFTYDLSATVFLFSDPNSTNNSYQESVTEPANSGSDLDGSYFWRNSLSGSSASPTYNWIDPITGGHTKVTNWTDDGTSGGDNSYFTVPNLGFVFNFYGFDYQTGNVFLNSNGSIHFGTPSPDSGSDASIPSTEGSNNFIAGALMDLDLSNLNPAQYPNQGLYYQLETNRAILTWYQAANASDSNEWITFQIVLQSNETAVVQYNDELSNLNSSSAPSTILGNALVGIENPSGTDGIQYRNDGAGSPMFCSPLSVAYGTSLANLVLPVELLQFVGKTLLHTNRLRWTTATERNVAYFRIERSQDGSHWKLLDKVYTPGESQTERHYDYLDLHPLPFAYYRLVTVDWDNSREVSPIVAITRHTDRLELLSLTPNPTTGILHLTGRTHRNDPVQFKLTDATGRVVLMKQANLTAGDWQQAFNLNNLSNGIYFLEVTDGLDWKLERVVKF